MRVATDTVDIKAGNSAYNNVSVKTKPTCKTMKHENTQTNRIRYTKL